MVDDELLAVAAVDIDTRPSSPTAERPLTGRVAVVTAATSGIDAATALRLVNDGAAVALIGRREERLDELAVFLDDDGVVPIAARSPTT